MSISSAPDEAPQPQPLEPPQPAAGGAAAALEFEALLGPQLRPAFSLALSLAGQREDAEDLVQAACVRAFGAFGRFERGTNFRAWLFRIVFNEFLHHRRDRARRPQTADIDELPEWSLYAQLKRAGLARAEGDPAAALLSKLDAQSIRAAFEGLPEEFRAVALLYFVQDFSYQEIAGIVSCPLGTVRSRLHRARRLLQRELWQVAQEAGLAPKPPRVKS